MKKIAVFMAAFAFMTASAFSEVYLNFTVPAGFAYHHQDAVDDPGFEKDSYSVLLKSAVTAEVFTTFGGRFGLGLKTGYEWNNGETYIDAGGYDVNADLRGFTIAPCLGWANEENTTKKKITLYPVIYEYLDFYRIDTSEETLKNTDITMQNLMFGAAFSFQWGREEVQHGFEFGFNVDWTSVLSVDNEDLGINGNGFGFWLGYKFSFLPFYER